jgi:hypothetical protein
MQLITSVRPTENRQAVALKRVVRAGDRDAWREAFEVSSVWLFPSTRSRTRR